MSTGNGGELHGGYIDASTLLQALIGSAPKPRKKKKHDQCQGLLRAELPESECSEEEGAIATALCWTAHPVTVG